MENQKLAEAIRFAKKHHGPQRYGDHPYHVHLGHVEQVLRFAGYGDDEELMIGAWLHDSLEDTPISYNDIKKPFGKIVAELVFAVTDELGRNRKERKSRTYPKIKGIKKATILKIADRIANMNFARESENWSFLKLYKKEHDSFIEGIYVRGIAEDMWDHLDLVVFTEFPGEDEI